MTQNRRMFLSGSPYVRIYLRYPRASLFSPLNARGLVAFGQSRVVEDRVDEIIDRAFRIITAWPMWTSSLAPSPMMWTPRISRFRDGK